MFSKKKFTKCLDYFTRSCCILYSDVKTTNGVIHMDMALMKKLNRQGLMFVGLHTLVMLNFAFDLLLL